MLSPLTLNVDNECIELMDPQYTTIADDRLCTIFDYLMEFYGFTNTVD